jgi:hypothetical protein
MPFRFGKKSEAALVTCDPDIQVVLREGIKTYDFTVLGGFRSPAEQFRIFKVGRELVRGKWIVRDKGKILTWLDGFEKISEHNIEPAEAVDVAPYPIDWKKLERFVFLAGFLVGLSRRLKAEGRIGRALGWGGDFDRDLDLDDQELKDYDHLFLIKGE